MTKRAKDAEILPEGSEFGRYHIEKRLGRGAMGAVYAATHVELKKRVAIKTLLPTIAEDGEARARFVREGQAAAKIRHPNVVDIYDVGTLDGISYLVMELLDGENMHQLLKREHVLSEQRAADLMLPVLAAIAVAHEEGVIHRDLKPSNVFLANGRDGEVVPKVVDFGISKIVSDDLSASLTGSGSLLGTPYYMSPEQAKGEKAIDARTDLYSLGVILYEMVTGKRPFKADSTYNLLTEIVQGRVEAPRALRPELSEAIERVILKAMARARDDRYPSVRDFGRALLPFAGARARVQWSPTFGDRGELEEESPEQQPEAALREPGVGPALTIGGRESIRVPRRPSTLLFAAGGVFLIAAAVLVFALFPRSNRVQVVAPEPEPPPIEKPPPVEEPQNPGTYTVAVEVDPKAAAFLLDGEPAGNGSFRRELPKDGREHTLIVSLEGYDQTRIVFRDSPVVQLVRLNPLPGAAKKPTPPPKKTKTRQGANEAPITD